MHGFHSETWSNTKNKIKINNNVLQSSIIMSAWIFTVKLGGPKNPSSRISWIRIWNSEECKKGCNAGHHSTGRKGTKQLSSLDRYALQPGGYLQQYNLKFFGTS